MVVVASQKTRKRRRKVKSPFSLFKLNNRPFSNSEKNQNGTVFCYILSNFRICAIHIEALTLLDRTARIKMYKNNARSSLFCRIAKRSIHWLPWHLCAFHAIAVY